MSHELRTPMNGIMAMTDLSRRRVTDPKALDQLGKALGAAERLLVMINDLIDISKMEAERFSLDRERFNVVAVLETLENRLHPWRVESGRGGEYVLV